MCKVYRVNDIRALLILGWPHPRIKYEFNDSANK